ncbi:MAG TPA: acetolactate decarboxylase [Acidimicrobiia bacterium]|nr:acetolactate decarboxylase [Acidimicrobiia bacterium]
MTPRLTAQISESVWRALLDESEKSGEPIPTLLDRVLATAFELDRHTLFQVSTSNALVQGVFGGAVTVGDLRRNGDFGLGTFEDLDGELVMIDGVCYRATGGGVVTSPADDAPVPFAVVTHFHPDRSTTTEFGTLADLTAAVDAIRPSENLFVGIRVDGRFARLALRAACAAEPGEGLLEATAHQSEFDVVDEVGTLVGFWAPTYARAVNVPGYHFHFISDDRQLGGHLLAMEAGTLEVGIHIESELHVAIPETEEFLAADLSGDHQEALLQAETAEHRSGTG